MNLTSSFISFSWLGLLLEKWHFAHHFRFVDKTNTLYSTTKNLHFTAKPVTQKKNLSVVVSYKIYSCCFWHMRFWYCLLLSKCSGLIIDSKTWISNCIFIFPRRKKKAQSKIRIDQFRLYFLLLGLFELISVVKECRKIGKGNSYKVVTIIPDKVTWHRRIINLSRYDMLSAFRYQVKRKIHEMHRLEQLRCQGGPSIVNVMLFTYQVLSASWTY